MSVFKSLTTTDVVVTPFKVNKTFTFQGSSSLEASNVGINRLIGKNLPTYTSGSNNTGNTTIYSSKLIYESIKQLYYSNFVSGSNGSPANLPQTNTDGVRVIEGGSGSFQPSYYNYLQNTLLPNRKFPTGSNDKIGVISIPSSLFGENIKPGTFSIKYAGSTIEDDGQGSLIQSGTKVGDIIYQHGMVILPTSGSLSSFLYGDPSYGTGLYGPAFEIIMNSDNITCSFQSTMTIYESQYKCTFNPSEFNYTQNPSSISGSKNNGVPYDFVTGSFFQPYITTVGLYNNANQLIAVGKLSQPLQSSNVTDTTILVNLDL